MAGIKTVIWLPGGHYTSVQLCHCSNYYSLHCNSGCISQGSKEKEKDHQWFYPVMDLNHFWSLVIFFVEIGLILGLAYVKGSPFIYFQF